MIPGSLASEVSAALRGFTHCRFRGWNCPFRGAPSGLSLMKALVPRSWRWLSYTGASDPAEPPASW